MRACGGEETSCALSSERRTISSHTVWQSASGSARATSPPMRWLLVCRIMTAQNDAEFKRGFRRTLRAVPVLIVSAVSWSECLLSPISPKMGPEGDSLLE
eukprot:6274190-Prymnesium_polylepis.2